MVTLAIGAHPDDVEFGCFGLLAKSADVYILIFTAGEISGKKNRRIAEARKGADVIGAKIKILGYDDGNIPVDGDIVKKLMDYVKDKNPDTVLVMHPDDTHQDHRNVANIVLSACRGVQTILFYEVPTTSRGFSPNYYVDITDTYDLKKKAIMGYETQKDKPYLNLSEIEGLAKYRAYNCFRPNKLFEGFMLYRHIEDS